MANIKFELKDPKATGSTSIRCIFYHQGKRFMYSLGDDRKISHRLWDKENMTPITGKTKDEKEELKLVKQTNPNIDTELKNISARIDNIKREIIAFISNQEINSRTWLFDELKNHLNSIFDKKEELKVQPVVIPLILNDYIEMFIDGICKGEIAYTTGAGQRTVYAASTIKAYKDFKSQFSLYQNVKKKNLNFKDINMEFYFDFVQYFSDKNYSNNSIGKQIKCLKAILSKALDDGIHNNDTFKKTAFKTLRCDVDNIYLTENELKAIYELDLSSKPHLDVARDIFLCGCYTALRFSDYKRIKPEHIVSMDDVLFIDMITKKTKYRVIIPVKPLVKNILEKYNNLLPKSYEQKINKYIKEIGRLAGIDDKVEVKTIRGANTIIEYIQKYKLIMTHTARRTGATLLYKAGVDTLSIMKITGHKTEKSLLKYIKISEEENAIKLMNNSFFQ